MSFIERYAETERRMNGFIKRSERPYIVVLGTSRAGTNYSSQVFQKAGLDIGHHTTLGKDGVVAFCATTFRHLNDCIVIQQVRYPLHQISSMTTSMKETWGYIGAHIDIRGHSLLRACMRYWLEWNKMASEKAAFRYRIEDMENQWDIICGLAGLEKCPFPAVSKTTNTRREKYTPFTWKQLEREDAWLCNQIQNLASYYGYQHIG